MKEGVLLCGGIPQVCYCLSTPLSIKAITMEIARLSILVGEDEGGKYSGWRRAGSLWNVFANRISQVVHGVRERCQPVVA